MGDEAFKGAFAPNTRVIDFDNKEHNVLDFLKDNRPLVLNFGSCSWPPFLFKFDEFKTLVKDFNSVADFLIVYIQEAHATDGWAFKNNVDIKKHQTLSDRFNAARMLLKEEPPCPVVVDSMDNMTSAKYGAMPERLYVVLNGKIIYKGDKGPWGYNPEKVRLILQNQS